MRRATSTAPSCWSMPASPRAEAMTNLLADNRPVIGDTRPSATSLGTREHVNPATGKAQAKVSIGGPAEIDAPTRAAVAGPKAWQVHRPERPRDRQLRLAVLHQPDPQQPTQQVTPDNPRRGE